MAFAVCWSSRFYFGGAMPNNPGIRTNKTFVTVIRYVEERTPVHLQQLMRQSSVHVAAWRVSLRVVGDAHGWHHMSNVLSVFQNFDGKSWNIKRREVAFGMLFNLWRCWMHTIWVLHVSFGGWTVRILRCTKLGSYSFFWVNELCAYLVFM